MWLIGPRRWGTNSHDRLSDCYWLCAHPEYSTMNSNQLPETSNDTNQTHSALVQYQPGGCQAASWKRLGALREMICWVAMEQPVGEGRHDFPFMLKRYTDKLAYTYPTLRCIFKQALFSSSRPPFPVRVGGRFINILASLWGTMSSRFLQATALKKMTE